MATHPPATRQYIHQSSIHTSVWSQILQLHVSMATNPPATHQYSHPSSIYTSVYPSIFHPHVSMATNPPATRQYIHPSSSYTSVWPQILHPHVVTRSSILDYFRLSWWLDTDVDSFFVTVLCSSELYVQCFGVITVSIFKAKWLPHDLCSMQYDLLISGFLTCSSFVMTCANVT
jgi:hypothetical protein